MGLWRDPRTGQAHGLVAVYRARPKILLFGACVVHEPCKTQRTLVLGHFRSQVGASEHTAPSAYFPIISTTRMKRKRLYIYMFFFLVDKPVSPLVFVFRSMYMRDLKMMPTNRRRHIDTVGVINVEFLSETSFQTVFAFSRT